MNGNPRTRIAVLLCVLLTSVACTPTPGQRLLTVQIEADGNVVYEGIRGVPDRTPVVEMWDVLDDVPFRLTATEDKVSETGEANIRTLEAAVVVRIKHVGRELASSLLKELTLQSKDGGTSWSLDAAEVARIKESAEE